jgi:tetratricopeptide (TPR) repeat protein
MSKEYYSSLLSMNLSDLRKEIECDQCQTPNPAKRCSRCHTTFYCSVQCQKEHWKTHKADCIPLQTMKSEIDGVRSINALESAAKEPITGTCSICLSEPMENPTMLPDCHHAFCFSCLAEWQKYIKYSSLYQIGSTTSSPLGSCPNCRETITKSIVDAAMEKTLMYAAAGRLVDKKYDHHLKGNSTDTSDSGTNRNVTMDERQAKYCTLAMDPIDKVLISFPNHLQALCIKGQFLRYIKPQESIDALQKTLAIDEIGAAKRKKLSEMADEIDALGIRMNNALTINEANAIEEEREGKMDLYVKMATESDDILQLGSGPHRLYRVKTWLAEAYESMGNYEEAVDIYKALLKEIYSFEHSQYIQIDPPDIRMILSGSSRCVFHLKDYQRAKLFAESALEMNRHFPGIHILKAQAQWAIGEKKEAVRTMCRGVIYETPWDDNNQEENRIYLKEYITVMH